VVTILVGVGAGVGGLALALLLRAIQHVAFGYSLDHVISEMSFLSGVEGASAARRVGVLALCGLVAGLGWYAVYRWGRPLVSISKAIKQDDPRMPVISTLAHAILQIVTVAMGSPLGREVAPREIGALYAGWLSHYAGLTPAESRIMVACGAGAGLAAVYNVPLGGAIFVLEVLLASFSWPYAVMALATSGIGAWVASLALGDESQYHLPSLAVSGALTVWAVLAGPVFGVAAYLFTRWTTFARSHAARGVSLPVLCVLNFAAIGVLSIAFAPLLGNGKGAAELGFSNDLTIAMAAILLVLRVLITLGTLRAGAEGGLLTPGLTNGALLAVVLGGVWSMAFPGSPPGAFAVIGAAAFLATSMKMPLTAIALIAEFARIDHVFLIPITLSVAGSLLTGKGCEVLAKNRARRRQQGAQAASTA
jgi:H+/Cl- antiporter ClcA